MDVVSVLGPPLDVASRSRLGFKTSSFAQNTQCLSLGAMHLRSPLGLGLKVSCTSMDL